MWDMSSLMTSASLVSCWKVNSPYDMIILSWTLTLQELLINDNTQSNIDQLVVVLLLGLLHLVEPQSCLILFHLVVVLGTNWSEIICKFEDFFKTTITRGFICILLILPGYPWDWGTLCCWCRPGDELFKVYGAEVDCSKVCSIEIMAMTYEYSNNKNEFGENIFTGLNNRWIKII